MTNSLTEQARAKAEQAACEAVSVSLASTPTVLRAARAAADAAITATLSLVEQEARERADEAINNDWQAGYAHACRKLADFCRHQREGS